MDNVMAIIKFIRSTSSLQHCLFRQLLSEMSAEHQDLLLHNDVRWLSKGKTLERFCHLREEIKAFLPSSKLKRAVTYLTQISDDNFMTDVYFLCDILRHFNDLNVGLQGRDKTVIDLVEQMGAFQVKLDIFTTDLSFTAMDPQGSGVMAMCTSSLTLRKLQSTCSVCLDQHTHVNQAFHT